MDCYRILSESRLAEAYAHEVINNGTAFDGTERSPMRNAEARVTLGVLAARDGDPDQAVAYGEQALSGQRKSLPSLLMCSQELATVLRQRYPTDSGTATYLDRLHALSHA
jgi:hypothetical protein